MPGFNPENEPVEMQYEEALLHGRHREPRPGAGSWAIWSGRCRPPSASPARAWPFGGAAQAMQQLRDETFKGRNVRGLQLTRDNKGSESGSWAG